MRGPDFVEMEADADAQQPFTRIDGPYEPHQHAEIPLPKTALGPEACAEQTLAHLLLKGLVREDLPPKPGRTAPEDLTPGKPC